eukprot:289735-Chlamydomonas_euryale.AAC.1
MPIEATDAYKKAKVAPVMEVRGSKFTKFQEAKMQVRATVRRSGGYVYYLDSCSIMSPAPGESILARGGAAVASTWLRNVE